MQRRDGACIKTNKESGTRWDLTSPLTGPAGAGKSTIAKKVSGELSYIYVDTGAMYRAMALYVAQQGIDPKDQEALSRECVHADITIAYENGEQVVLLDGKNVNDRIRTEAVSSMASVTSVNPDVRKKLMVLQQKLAREKDVVMDGRDIGTCVLPDANLKIYLTASVETRARRRFLEYEEKGIPAVLEEIEEEIRIRDDRDMHRDTAPLVQAKDAVFIDSSHMTIEEVTEEIIRLAKERGA